MDDHVFVCLILRIKNYTFLISFLLNNEQIVCILMY